MYRLYEKWNLKENIKRQSIFLALITATLTKRLIRCKDASVRDSHYNSIGMEKARQSEQHFTDTNTRIPAANAPDASVEAHTDTHASKCAPAAWIESSSNSREPIRVVGRHPHTWTLCDLVARRHYITSTSTHKDRNIFSPFAFFLILAYLAFDNTDAHIEWRTLEAVWELYVQHTQGSRIAYAFGSQSCTHAQANVHTDSRSALQNTHSWQRSTVWKKKSNKRLYRCWNYMLRRMGIRVFHWP